MKASEFRIGNILNYTTAEGDILTTSLDWQDIKWISEDPKGFNLVHAPIPITEEILFKSGFEITRIHNNYYFRELNEWTNIFISLYKNECAVELSISKHGYCTEVKHLHELQNLYFALTGQELQINL